MPILWRGPFLTIFYLPRIRLTEESATICHLCREQKDITVPSMMNFPVVSAAALDSYTRHSEYIYAHTDSDLFVNLFIASELTWKEKGIAIRQETEFPFKDMTSLKVKCSNDTEMGLRIRNPLWLAGPMIISINSQTQDLTPSDGYFSINRIWKDGDVVEIKLPMKLRSESMPDDRNKIAFFYGPVLLAGALEQKEATYLVRTNHAPALIPGDLPFDQWLEPAGAPSGIYNEDCTSGSD